MRVCFQVKNDTLRHIHLHFYHILGFCPVITSIPFVASDHHESKQL